MAQNYGANAEKIKIDRRLIRRIERSTEENWDEICKPRSRREAISRIKQMANKEALKK